MSLVKGVQTANRCHNSKVSFHCILKVFFSSAFKVFSYTILKCFIKNLKVSSEVLCYSYKFCGTGIADTPLHIS